MRRGEIDTLDHLWAVKDDMDKVTAVLISTSPFSEFESRRGPKPEKMAASVELPRARFEPAHLRKATSSAPVPGTKPATLPPVRATATTGASGHVSITHSK